MNIIYDKIAMPAVHSNYLPVNRNTETMEEHRSKVLAKMKERALDALLI